MSLKQEESAMERAIPGKSSSSYRRNANRHSLKVVYRLPASNPISILFKFTFHWLTSSFSLRGSSAFQVVVFTSRLVHFRAGTPEVVNATSDVCCLFPPVPDYPFLLLFSFPSSLIQRYNVNPQFSSRQLVLPTATSASTWICLKRQPYQMCTIYPIYTLSTFGPFDP